MRPRGDKSPVGCICADVIDQTSMEECNGDPQKSAESDRYWSSSRGGWTCPLAEPDSGPNCSENLRLGPRLVARWMVLEARGRTTPCQGPCCLHAKLHRYGG